ncbi:MAG TPA: FHA domain-containing protein, partial [Planctomycetes bacterium]|nr:FHA domain-containing protein [Planctomycetota bacterium]
MTSKPSGYGQRGPQPRPAATTSASSHPRPPRAKLRPSPRAVAPNPSRLLPGQTTGLWDYKPHHVSCKGNWRTPTFIQLTEKANARQWPQPGIRPRTGLVCQLDGQRDRKTPYYRHRYPSGVGHALPGGDCRPQTDRITYKGRQQTPLLASEGDPGQPATDCLMQATLVVVKGKANKSRVVVKLPSVIGRSREADLRVAHPMVSRHHCQLYEENGLLKIRDLGSLNGVYVGNQRVTEAVLPPNAVFSVGPISFRAEYEYIGLGTPDAVSPPEAQTAPPSPRPTAPPRAPDPAPGVPDEQPVATIDGPPAIAPSDGALPDFGQPADQAALGTAGANGLGKTLPQVSGGPAGSEPTGDALPS